MDAFAGKNPVYRFGEFELEAGRRILRSVPANSIVTLTPRAFDLLLVFLRRPQELIGKAELMAQLWPDTVVEDNSLDQAVYALRHGLGDRPGDHRYIKTIHRRGYQFTMPVEVNFAAPAAAAPVQIPAPFWTRRNVVVSLVVALSLAVALGVMLTRSATWPPRPAAAAAGTDAILAIRHLAATPDDDGQMLADAVTRMLEHRFAAVSSLQLIAPESTWTRRDAQNSVTAFGRGLNARFVLSGEIARQEGRLRLSATMTDMRSGAALWSKLYEFPDAGITAVREDIAARATAAMHVAPAVTHPAARTRVELEVYELYVRADRLMAARAVREEVQSAAALFTRTTVLDPQFARGYLGIAQALMYLHDVEPNLDLVRDAENARQARAAVDRALELNPGLGEAWVAKARLTGDAEQADRMFRRGLQLAPNYINGAMFYYDFLGGHERVGEAIDVINRARRLDPASPVLLWLEAVAVMAARSDVAASDRLLRQALELEGGEKIALIQLALSLHHEHGQFAEAMRLMQRLPADGFMRSAMAKLYLDLGEPQAASDVWNAADPPPDSQHILISEYLHDTAAAAAVARNLFAASRTDGVAAGALRDQAVATHDYAGALALLQAAYASRPRASTRVSFDTGFSIVFAHVLILSGQVKRGRDLARAQLVSLDVDEIGRPPHWFGRARAQLLALLGEKDRAIAELAADQQLDHWSGWWYTADVDPIFAPLRNDPKFKALVTRAHEHRAAQHALFEEMVRRGDIRVAVAAHP
ncbi:MAG TPA: winged helix-turn-helix domain-containing protein [Steroidobacteraceae bacterium]|jgi:DNA-binding winged helix-turn-helix (wHTH) protein/TolB-like protein/Tfp pilus assembly protein PilF|nr:winged helix-turn-helix domain-containing protein [Steroidobacteraceae bacterium]